MLTFVIRYEDSEDDFGEVGEDDEEGEEDESADEDDGEEGANGKPTEGKCQLSSHYDLMHLFCSTIANVVQQRLLHQPRNRR